MLDRSQDEVRLAGQFQQAGYATYGVWSAPFLHPAYGYQGSSGEEFDRYISAEEYLRDGENSEIITNPQMRRMMEVHGLADATFDNALSMMDRITTQHEKMSEHLESARRKRSSSNFIF